MNRLEICISDIESGLTANRGGADRVEVCSALNEGGTTPSCGLIEEIVQRTNMQVHVLIRPRGGDFIYTEAEIKTMLNDITVAKRAGAHGVVIGALDKNGNIDYPTCKRLVEAADGMSVTFHRAFDLSANLEQALEDVINLGCERILSSGGAPTAIEGLETLRKLNRMANGRIIIMAGCGVNPSNANKIIEAGIHELHASARDTVTSKSIYRRNNVKMGNEGDEYSWLMTSENTVRMLAKTVHTH